MHVYCDFDGTISLQDATDVILSRFAAPEWQLIEEEWKLGLIGSAECMQRQIALINANQDALDAVLDHIDIDTSFPDFINFCHASHISVTVISDGVDYFIRRILSRFGLKHIPIIANRLHFSLVGDSTEYSLSSPYSATDCISAAGVCKCRAVSSSDMRIYIGDGRSDFCVSSKPDIVFAKDKLATYCAQQDIAFIGYQRFADITHALRRSLPDLLCRGNEKLPEFTDYAVA